MVSLIFNDRGWTVVTNAWTAASKSPGRTTIAYTWGADGISFFDSATGTAKIEFEMDITAFINAVVSARNVLDLR